MEAFFNTAMLFFQELVQCALHLARALLFGFRLAVIIFQGIFGFLERLAGALFGAEHQREYAMLMFMALFIVLLFVLSGLWQKWTRRNIKVNASMGSIHCKKCGVAVSTSGPSENGYIRCPACKTPVIRKR